jgi:hypothetical protein
VGLLPAARLVLDAGPMTAIVTVGGMGAALGALVGALIGFARKDARRLTR